MENRQDALMPQISQLNLNIFSKVGQHRLTWIPKWIQDIDNECLEDWKRYVCFLKPFHLYFIGVSVGHRESEVQEQNSCSFKQTFFSWSLVIQNQKTNICQKSISQTEF